jgi:hypothetical protein
LKEQTVRRLIVPALAALGMTISASLADEAGGLAAADFEKLLQELHSPREAWQSIPWRLSLLEAREQAAKEKKPIYMLARAGHPLGCV